MTALKWLLVVLLFGYSAVLVGMYLAQRSLLYHPDPVRRAPSSVGLADTTEVVLTAADGTRLLAWYAPPAAGEPLVLYFQGNGGGLDLRAHRFRALAAAGMGFLALNYRGFGGSSGSPTQAGLIQDAEAAYRFAAAREPPSRIALWGESLGTGVAITIAAHDPVARVVLESPYTSIADVAAAIYWFLPVRRLVKDRFDVLALAEKITAPVLVVQGARDEVIPIGIGKRLYDALKAPKRFVNLPQAGHNDHDDHGALGIVVPFLARGELPAG